MPHRSRHVSASPRRPLSGVIFVIFYGVARSRLRLIDLVRQQLRPTEHSRILRPPLKPTVESAHCAKKIRRVRSESFAMLRPREKIQSKSATDCREGSMRFGHLMIAPMAGAVAA